jgi:ATP-dependent Clp protease ATP-binding subunit ClpA
MKAGFNTPSRPLLVVFFAGPTGVGKTEMAYALSDFLWVSEKNALKESKKKGRYVPFNEKEIIEPPIIEVDCGEFAGSLSHGVSNLIGSPAGYVGSKGTGKGAQPPVFNPQNFPKNRIKVLLLDEIEKAFINSRDNGAEIMGVLMKILDKGKLVNNWEEEVDFTRTIIIFTSNIGSVEIMKSAEDPKIGFGAGIKRKDLSDKAIEQLNEKIYDVTKREYEKLFRPEFRNRINRFIAFHFLSSAEYIAIIKKEFAEIVEKRARELGFAIELSTEILDWFLNEIKGEEGVRKLRDFMQKEISEPIAKAYNLKKLKAGKTYIVKIKAVPVPNDKDKVEMKAYFVVKSSSGGS